MGSKTFDGVRFAAFVEDHPPSHVHGHYAGAVVIIDLLIERRAVRLSSRRKSIQPPNAKRSDVNHIRRTAQLYFDELVAIWEKCAMKQEVLDLTTEAEIDAALEEARNLPPEPHALSAEYNRAADVIILHTDNGRRLVIPREEMQGLRDATPEQIGDIQVFFGVDICWPQLDLDHNFRSLLKGRYGNDCWMQSLEHPVAA